MISTTRLFRVRVAAAVLSTLTCPLAAADLELLYHNSFEEHTHGPRQEVVEGRDGRGARDFRIDARELLNSERGTFAFFLKVEQAPEATPRRQYGGGAGISFGAAREAFFVQATDIGGYSPPLPLPPIIGRWQPGEWRHLAVVWDRHQGVKVYEDGELQASNWGRYRWHWSVPAGDFALHGTCDDLHIFGIPLTDAQIAQLARGEAPTGSPLPLAPEAARREHDLARLGWTGEDLASLPVVRPDRPQQLTFARIVSGVDVLRPIGRVFDGFPTTTWGHVTVGGGLRGQVLDLELEPGSRADHLRLIAARPFRGGVRILEGAEIAADAGAATLPVDMDAASHHRRMPLRQFQRAQVLRQAGELSRVDFYRVEALDEGAAAAPVDSYTLAPAEQFPDSELGRNLQATTPLRLRQPVLATRSRQQPWTLQSPAFGGFQAFTEPPTEAKAFDGVRLRLVVDGLSQPTPLRITVREPVHTAREWLSADVVLQPRGEKGPQTFTVVLKGRPVINIPPLRIRKPLQTGGHRSYVTRPPLEKEFSDAPGTSFGLSIEAGSDLKWVMGEGGTTLDFCTLPDVQQALPAAAEDQIEYLREAYAVLMEGHQYWHPRFQLPLTWFALFAPDHFHFRQMYERIGSPDLFEGIQVPPIVYDPPANTTGAPEWAFWQMQAMKEHWRLLHWHIDRQLPHGGYGDLWNDDTIHIDNWIGHALCMDDSGKIKDSLRKFWEGVWEHSLEEGVGKFIWDATHFAEEGMASIPLQLLIDYGDPVVHSRVLTAASHYEKWLRKTEAGYWWKSYYMGLQGVWDQGEFGRGAQRDTGGHMWDVMVPAGYLIWYNRHPVAGQYVVGLRDEQTRRTGRDDYSVLFHGAAADRISGLEAALPRYAQAAAEPNPRLNYKILAAWTEEVGVTDAIREAHARPYAPLKPIAHYWGSHDAGAAHLQWKLTGDIRYLVDSYRRVCEWFHSHDWLNTETMPSLDRNPLPRGSLIPARMGALAANRATSGLVWPRYALSYTKGADDVAALVTDNTYTSLAVRLYPFTDQPHDVQVRVWRLHPGEYRVRLMSDRDDDGQGEDVLMDQQMTLGRGAYVDFTLPPRQGAILSIEGVETAPPDYTRPDPAISARTIDLTYGHYMVIKVYNLGSKPAENVLVRVRDAHSGEVIVDGEQRIERIEPALDFQPRYGTVEIHRVRSRVMQRMIIEVDPEGEIDDLNRFNNRVEVDL